MQALELIEILKKNPELEVKVMEIGKYEDNIPILSIESCDVEQSEDTGDFEIILKVK